MIRPNMAVRTLAVLVAGSMALAACGNGDESSDGGDAPAGDGTLKIGTILPQTGSLAFLGPPEFAAVDLAIKEINEAGGVLGKDVEVSHTDSGDTSTDIASQSADRLIAQDVDAIIGAASSGVSLNFIDKLYEAEIVQISPANTSDAFTTHASGDYYFRTAPADTLQGRVLSNQVLADGNEKVAILALQDAYGTGLAGHVESGVTGGGGEVVLKEIYDPQAAEFSAEVAKVKAANPDAIVLVTFNEIVKLAPALIEAGLGPDTKKWYFVDGNLSNYKDDFPAGALEGVKGTLPGAAATEEFKTRLLGVNPDLQDYAYAPESYDAVVLAALAAIAANSDNATAIKDNLVDVSKGGEKCTTFADCKALLEEDKDIDYDGVSGPIEFSDKGDPTAATIGIYVYGPDNTYTNQEYVTGTL
jgi:branched-chain amino acid transport system substrate-binding protein